MGATLKPFQITLNDIDFIHQQVTFPRIKVIGYDATGAAIYGLVWTDSAGLTHSDVLGYLGTFDPLQIINPLTDLPLYASARVADGLRDVSGTYNNLTDLGTTYGTFESQFIRITAPDRHRSSVRGLESAIRAGRGGFHLAQHVGHFSVR